MKLPRRIQEAEKQRCDNELNLAYKGDIKLRQTAANTIIDAQIDIQNKEFRDSCIWHGTIDRLIAKHGYDGAYLELKKLAGVFEYLGFTGEIGQYFKEQRGR